MKWADLGFVWEKGRILWTSYSLKSRRDYDKKFVPFRIKSYPQTGWALPGENQGAAGHFNSFSA
jgi:hypothetical protein